MPSFRAIRAETSGFSLSCTGRAEIGQPCCPRALHCEMRVYFWRIRYRKCQLAHWDEEWIEHFAKLRIPEPWPRMAPEGWQAADLPDPAGFYRVHRL